MRALSALAIAIVTAANSQRAERRLAPLKEDARLEAAARGHSEEMLRLGKMSHESPDQALHTPAQRASAAGVAWKTVGENVAHFHGYRPTGAEAVTDWLGSPEHRANLLRRGFTMTGVGAACDAKDCYLTQLFASE